METLTKMSKPYFITNDPADVDRVRAYIKDYVLKHTDPCAWATQQMFNKLKNPNPGIDSDSYDTVAWDNDEWVPKGTAIKPHPWDM